MSVSPPPYVVQAGIQALPLDFRWDGSGEHTGPMQTVTKLLARLAGTTTCGQVSLCAGVLQWGAWRLSPHTPVDSCLRLAEAAFAYQVDFRYLDFEQRSKEELPDEPPALSAMMELDRFMAYSIDADEYWNSYYQPVTETFHSVHLVRHILPKPKRKMFEEWLNAVVDRIKVVAPKPEEEFKKKKEFDSVEAHKAFVARHRGNPLPPEIIDPGFDYNDEIRVELIDQFLQSLDWGANRYLRSPDEMKEIGFEGTPYRLCP